LASSYAIVDVYSIGDNDVHGASSGVLDSGSASLLSEVLNLRSENADLLAEGVELRSENARLQAEVGELRDVVAFLREENALLAEKVKRITGGRGGNDGSSSEPQPNPLKQRKERKQHKERKKRTQNFARKREPGTRQVPHVAETCPDCGRKLKGGWEHARRQIIDIPAVPAEVVDHIIIARHCGVCDKRVLPKRDFSGLVIGKHRIGIRIMSIIAYLCDVARMPVHIVQEMLKSLWNLSISEGEISNLRRDVARIGRPIYDILREEIREAPFKQSDETSWREDGVGGELWSLSTPTTRYFAFGSREAKVIQDLLRGSLGTLVCDFYAGYNQVGEHRQRCWRHYASDLHDLKEAHPNESDTINWANDVLGVYRVAKKYQQECREALAKGGPCFGYTVFDRKRARKNFEEQLLALARRDVPSAPHRQKVLAQRIENFLSELFTFVEFPEVPSDNNAAERAIRPAVITRKVCGGTRSTQGTETKMVLMSLLHTWKARGLSTIDQCFEMLAAQSNPARGPTTAPAM